MQDNPTVVNASAPEDFDSATTKLTLPIPGRSGRPLVAEIEAATLEELVPLMKGIAGLSRDDKAEGDPLELTLEFVRRQGEQSRPLVERFVLSPRISFTGPQPGMVEWQKIHLINRLALVNAISEYAQTGSVRRAERLATFLVDNEGGAGNGGGPGVAVKNGNATAQEVPIA